jgi:hypothetical protein
MFEASNSIGIVAGFWLVRITNYFFLEARMTLARSNNVGSFSLISAIQSILVWSFVLAVCMIVIGFPVLVLVVSVASLLAFTLHSIMPMSAVLLTAAVFLGVHIAGILGMATFLTAKGIYPHDVDWMVWLRGRENPVNTSVYAACPLTCDIKGAA